MSKADWIAAAGWAVMLGSVLVIVWFDRDTDGPPEPEPLRPDGWREVGPPPVWPEQLAPNGDEPADEEAIAALEAALLMPDYIRPTTPED